MANATTAAPGKGFRAWLNKRLPVDDFIESQLHGYYAPKNFNIWYFFGALALLTFVLQLVTGIFLTMHYKPGEATAFDSVEYIMREVPNGWLLRYLHSTGASFFFLVVYLHMFRALMYGSYRAPRELLWLLGMFVYLAMMAEGFFGYVLPWGNMSFWGAQVIVNLFGTIPVVGPGLVDWIRGDYGIADATLNRFFSLHVVAVPFVLALLILLHLVALRQVGSNNPDGIEIKDNLGADGKPVDGIPFHPYYTIKDVMGVGVFLALFAVVVFFAPTFGGYFLEGPNFEPANPLSTPEHIAPVWYFTPYYAILRAVPDQALGALLMALSVAVWLFVPWLDRSPVRSIRYKGWMSRMWLGIFVVSFLVLMVLGLLPAEGLYVILARIFTVLYFAFFILMPFYTKAERTKAPPSRVTMSHALIAAVFIGGLLASGRVSAAEEGGAVDICAPGEKPAWKHWAAESETDSLPSLQRGARDFMGYCSGCHSLKYMRYSRLAADLKIPEAQAESLLFPPGADKNAYITTALAQADGENWFGKAPPDLSLIVRAKGADYVYQFLKTYYADEKSVVTGVNNLALPSTAMPHVLGELQGVQTAVFRNCERKDEEGNAITESVFEKFEKGTSGRMSAAEYDGTVRDLVNFLDYVGDPSQNERRDLGVWVVLFLLAFSGIAYFLKQEYWKDVH